MQLSTMIKPMPMRPRLPMGGIQLAASSSISTELADTPCPSTCRRNSTCNGHGVESAPAVHAHCKTHNSNPSSSSSSGVLRKPPPVKSSCGENHYHPLVTEQQPSFSNLDLFRMDDYADDMIPSSEQMNFDDSIMTLVTEESNQQSSMSTHLHRRDHSCDSRDHRQQQQQQQFQHYNHQQQPEATQSSYSNNNDDGMDAFVLHRTVLLFPNDANLVHTAIVGSPKQAALTPSPLPHSGYYFPLHLAICQGANLPVLQLLVQAGPQVLLQKDGPQGFTPLMLSLDHLPNRPDVHELLRKACPQAASIPCDANQELPLHVACRLSACSKNGCLGLIQGLLQDHPAAVLHASCRGFTPLQLVAMQPITSPHRTILYQSLQFVSQQVSQQHPLQRMAMGGPPGALTAPC